MQREVICVDLGSAYTKVSLRRSWDASTDLVRDLVPQEQAPTYCLPSVVARVDRAGAAVWLTGESAAAQPPGSGVRIYPNWKASFFGRDSAGEDAAADEASEVAFHFFCQLREALARSRTPIDVSRLPLRICIPKLAGIEDDALRIVEVATRAGWKPAMDRPTLFEPEANVIGVYTRGRNATWTPPHRSGMRSVGRSPSLRKMLEERGLVEALARVKGTFSILTVDVGAFTTDFGVIEIDTSFGSDEWQHSRVIQHSERLGIRDLDRVVRRELTKGTLSLGKVSPREWDRYKALLYQSSEASFFVEGKQVVVGREGDQALITAAIDAFTREVVARCAAFLHTPGLPRIDAVSLTGGGAMIQRVRSALRRALPSSYTLDLIDAEEPSRAVPKVNGRPNFAAMDVRRRQNAELVRGGSAIGAASVFFG